jgi:hypothetical protein
MIMDEAGHRLFALPDRSLYVPGRRCLWGATTTLTTSRRGTSDLATLHLMRRLVALKALLIPIVFVAMIRLSAAEPRYTTGYAYEGIGDLARYCLGEGSVSKKPACWSYILGVADTQLAGGTICIRDHKEYYRLKLADMVIRHLQASHDPFDLGAASVVQDILEDHFPCQKPPEGPDGYWSLGTLRKACDAEGEPNAPVTSCKGYIVGVVDTLGDLDAQATCIPNNVGSDLLIDAVRRFIEPALFSLFSEHASDPPATPAAVTLVKFFRKNFACGTKR